MTNPLAAAALAAALAAVPALASAEEIRVALPDSLELVEVQPGLQVVSRLDLEVFYSDGAYWLRHSGRWYASRRPAAGFDAAEARTVPPALAKLEPGKYLEYRPAAGQRVVQRRLDAEPVEAGGAEVNAGQARVAPRGTLMPAEPADAAPAKAEPRPAARAPAAPAAAPAKGQARTPAKAPPAKKPPAKPAPKPKK